MINVILTSEKKLSVLFFYDRKYLNFECFHNQ